MQSTFHNDYTIVYGVPRISAQSVTMTISPGASDPDGDPLSYSWTATNGSINGSGLTADWTRVVTNYVLQPGVVTVTASDGKGGTASYDIHFS